MSTTDSITKENKILADISAIEIKDLDPKNKKTLRTRFL